MEIFQHFQECKPEGKVERMYGGGRVTFKKQVFSFGAVDGQAQRRCPEPTRA
jgi:hypothetical protein